MLELLTARQYLIFRMNLERRGDCLEWTAMRSDKGYGLFHIGLRAEGTRRIIRAHRLAWELEYAFTDVDELCVLHSCDNPPCCEPDHLFLGTRVDNNRDMTDKGRRGGTRGEANMHAKVTEADVRAIRGSDESNRTLSNRFHVEMKQIQRIRNLHAWKHVS